MFLMHFHVILNESDNYFCQKSLVTDVWESGLGVGIRGFG